jgi:hypothetical protein
MCTIRSFNDFCCRTQDTILENLRVPKQGKSEANELFIGFEGGTEEGKELIVGDSRYFQSLGCLTIVRHQWFSNMTACVFYCLLLKEGTSKYCMALLYIDFSYLQSLG